MTSDSLLGGGYLLSHFRSTIGVVRLNFSVRNGKRWDPHAMAALLTLRPGRLSTLPNPGGGGAAVMSKRNHRGNAARENHANHQTGEPDRRAARAYRRALATVPGPSCARITGTRERDFPLVQPARSCERDKKAFG